MRVLFLGDTSRSPSIVMLALITLHAKILRNVYLYRGRICSHSTSYQVILLTEGGSIFEDCSLSRQF